MQACKICSGKKISVIEQAFDGLCERCSIMVIAYNRYAESNIPINYWDLEMKDFKGSSVLKKVYDETAEGLVKFYQQGDVICLAGSHGIGKSMSTTCILKKACQKNYTCLYTTISDIVSALIDSSSEEKFLARRELMMVDFLAIDEMDPRFTGSDSAADLFGRTLEHVFRTRTQNKLPVIICTNSPNPIESFSGAIKQSLDSLMSRIRFIPVMDRDFRKEGK